MPPPEAHKQPLNKAEQQLIRQWIEDGATYNTFWAFESPRRPDLPVVKNTTWSHQPIDLHVLNRLESLGLEPAQSADERTLVRRVTLDLTGLPPTTDEIKTYFEERLQFGDAAWERLIDRLLERPQYGEHMSRYWLDLVRFADTNGMHKDFYRNHVAYRDWVIRSFNDNLGYDDFVRYQMAGDLYPEPSRDQLVASGFHRLHLIIDRGTALPEESQTKNVLDRVTAVGTAFMGLTVHCAQCHDHKYDPITQQDFYSLYAFMNNIDAEPETQARPPKGLQPPFISFATPEQDQQLAEFDRRLGALDQQLSSTKKQLESCEDEKEKQAIVQAIKQIETERNAVKQQRNRLDQMIPGAMVMKERADVRPTFILNRGQYDSPGDPVERDTPAFLPPLQKQGKIATRMDLAQWLVSPENPLTARVAVNRFWQQFFGVGLVKTSEDFGAQGEVPSHPELLDYLTVELVDSGWDVKSLVKQIVMSKTYRQSSTGTPERFNADPENRWLARGSRFRMDAEMIRDQILATSGLLSKEMYGKSVKPPQPDGLWKAVTMTGERFTPDSGDAIYRRSVYTFWKRAMPPPQMTILNAPNRDACIARRERTNTPSQALLLLNESEYFKAASRLAIGCAQRPADQRIDYAWEVVTSRLPSQQERTVVSSLIG